MKKPANVAPNVQLRRAREREGWSQQDVAQRVGTEAFTVSRWERGVVIPSHYFRQKLCGLFGVSASELGLVPAETAIGEQAERVASEPDVPAGREAALFDPAIPAARTREQGLVGRDELLRGLKEHLMVEGRAALSAINGLPGVGKTALVTALAHDEEVRGHFAGGVLWAGLGREPDVLGMLSRWGTLLGCTPPEMTQRSRAEVWATAMHAAIGQRAMLLVIDDVWDIGDALALQVGGPNCASVVTTRFPEIGRRFAAEGAMVVRELGEAEGRLLLLRLAPELVEAEPDEAQALVEVVGGLPLALTLLGNYLRVQAHSGQPRRLRAALERLRNADERLRLAEPQALIGGHPSMLVGAPLSLQAVIGLSDQQVSEGARRALRALAIFPPKPNTFSEEAALAVSELPVETLDELLDAGLLESSGPERYTLHQTIVDYARGKLEDGGVGEQLVGYYVPFVEGHTADYAALERESSNILAALEVAYERGMQSEVVRGAHALEPFLEIRGMYAVIEKQAQRSLQAARTLEDANGEARARLYLGKLRHLSGNYAQARENWQEGLTLARQGEGRDCEAKMLRELGEMAWQQGQPELARQYMEEALTILDQLGDGRGIAEAKRNLGNVAVEQGEPKLARQLYEEALAIFEQLGDEQGAAFTWQNLAILAREQGQPELARQLYEDSLATLRRLGDKRRTAILLLNLGNLVRQQGQPELARQLLEEALTIHRQLGYARGVTYALLNLGNLALDEGQFERAREFLDEGLAVSQGMQESHLVALIRVALAEVARERGNFEQEQEHLDQGLAILEGLHDRRQIAITQRERGALARRQGQLEQAQQLIVGALETLTQFEDLLEAALAHYELGILARLRGRLEEARFHLMEALATFRQLKDLRHVPRALKELSALLLQQGRPEEALPLLLSAAVGGAYIGRADAFEVEKMIGQARAEVGEEAFLAMARRVARESPEGVYGMGQKAWATAVRKLVMGRV